MKSQLFFIILLMITAIRLSAQEPALSEKPGTFEILARTNYTSPRCGFTKAEVEANLVRIKDLAAIMRLNPVLSDIKGFNSRVRIHNFSMCDYKEQYGLPVRVAFEFCAFFRNKNGEVVTSTIEPPQRSFYLNTIVPWGYNFLTTGSAEVSGYFIVPLNKKTLAPGIDLYDLEKFIIYDPARPDYWVPVTVEEAMACAYEKLKDEKNEIAAKMLKECLDKELAAIPPEDMTKPAYYGGAISGVSNKPGFEGQDSLFPRIMKVNPHYWNRNLPRSAIQLINFDAVQLKAYYSWRRQESNKESIKPYSMIFEESLSMDDFRRLAGMIGK
jgi:hypothetical protein